VCFNYGAVGEYLVWLLYVPILLFYIRGSRAGLYGLVFIIGQLTIFFPLSTYVVQPNGDEFKLLPAAHKWFVMLMTYLIVGVTAFVHETSRSKGIVKLKRREELNEQLQEAAQAKTGLLLNISHGSPRPPFVVVPQSPFGQSARPIVSRFASTLPPTQKAPFYYPTSPE
jgi:cbb3-type cytochrome oxidase subunit 3